MTITGRKRHLAVLAFGFAASLAVYSHAFGPYITWDGEPRSAELLTLFLLPLTATVIYALLGSLRLRSATASDSSVADVAIDSIVWCVLLFSDQRPCDRPGGAAENRRGAGLGVTGRGGARRPDSDRGRQPAAAHETERRTGDSDGTDLDQSPALDTHPSRRWLRRRVGRMRHRRVRPAVGSRPRRPRRRWISFHIVKGFWSKTVGAEK